MNENEQTDDSGSDRAIEHGETYYHAEQGYVEVTGIWQRTQRLDTIHNTDEQDMIVIRYLPAENGEWRNELAEPLDDFLEATG